MATIDWSAVSTALRVLILITDVAGFGGPYATAAFAGIGIIVDYAARRAARREQGDDSEE
ncbi:hypothetical protein HQ602_18670 [Rhodococcus kroppenstedtii]|uniref:hypothetical protein n=1 Tax=Rhodococcoides kroppenstedtii TaxID=293050 RepID=UPI001C9B690A|nr:hypothetical protein [Rhodococcus kroppenstedtii]MBY6438400.1 hypothetical protein [Rhodococcus kroppenstedtii]